MWEESSEKAKPLRTGFTTGTCATACSLSAACFLFDKKPLNTVSITLPKGKIVELEVNVRALNDGSVYAETIKDAGDDPDVTHGATIFAQVSLHEAEGVHFIAGDGVGTVTRDGLALAVGEPAINPVPRQMITDHLLKLAAKHEYAGGFSVTIGVVNGEALAQKTMNPRLGILGGLSILGTTGIVRPFSCAAWIASIHQGIDVASANNISHIAASTGNSSEAAVKNLYGLNEMALIEMGDFAGAVLKHIKKLPKEGLNVRKLSVCGGFGKITKLANGHMDLNSRASSIDFDAMAETALSLGCDNTLADKIRQANTSIEVLKLCQAEGIQLADKTCEKALAVCETILPSDVEVEVMAIDRQGGFVGYAGAGESPLS